MATSTSNELLDVGKNFHGKLHLPLVSLSFGIVAEIGDLCFSFVNQLLDNLKASERSFRGSNYECYKYVLDKYSCLFHYREILIQIMKICSKCASVKKKSKRLC